MKKIYFLCNKCGLNKTYEEFYKSKIDTKRYICLKCDSERAKKYHKEHRDEILIKQKERYIKNKKHHNAQTKLWAKKNNHKIKVQRRTAKARFDKSIIDSRNKNVLWNISFDNYSNLIKQTCFYCDEITFGIECGIGLDRINNEGSYTLDNVKPCCRTCNIIKNKFSINILLKKLPKMIDKIRSII